MQKACLKAVQQLFCAAWVAAVPPPPLPAKPLHLVFFFLALVHHRGDGYGCSGSGTFRASWHLEGIKLFQVQVQFSSQDLKPLMLRPPPPSPNSRPVWLMLWPVGASGSGDKRGWTLSISSWYPSRRLSLLSKDSEESSFTPAASFCLWYDRNSINYSVCVPRRAPTFDLTSNAL